MNFHQCSPDVFRFELYNLNYSQEAPQVRISGHYRFWFHRGNRAYCFTRHGAYYNLVSILPCDEKVVFPSPEEHEALGELMSSSLRGACFYDGERSCNHGPYLLPELEAACLKDDKGHGREWFPGGMPYKHVMKTSKAFPAEYPDADYKVDQGYWDQLRRQDQEAITMLNGVAPNHPFCHPLEHAR